jgi:L,D-transpeptidase ErfK/SrfK
MRYNIKKILMIVTCTASMFATATSMAKTFPLPADGNIVGEISTTIVRPGENFAQIARDHDLGYVELREANPGVDPENPTPGSVLVIPGQYILPNAPYKGIVVNLAEMRLYYYPTGRKEVSTYPIGIGRDGEETLAGVFSVIEHTVNPTWYPTAATRRASAENGVILPAYVPPGPENPLGKYRMRLSNPTYLIHGTNDPLGGVGRRSSAGCLRLYPEDIEPLFHAVENGTTVYIINEPYKAGTSYGRLYLESHVPLEEDGNRALADATQIKEVIGAALSDRDADVNWQKALQISEELQGIPQEIGVVG